jgi:aminoglycoside phosphotransferase (APT) family kinase protein
LGDPRADFAYHLMMYRMPPTVMKSLYKQNVAALGLPSESDYIAAYQARIDCEPTGNLDFFLAFNFFRLAAITHGIKGRVLRGTAVGTEAVARSQHVPDLAQVAWNHAVRAGARR